MKRVALAEQLELAPSAPEKKKRPRQADTSRAAAASLQFTRTEALRTLIWRTIRACELNPAMRGATADEVHAMTAATEMERGDVRRLMEIRRRISDLHATLHEIRATPLRRENEAGNPMIVWGIDPNGSWVNQ